MNRSEPIAGKQESARHDLTFILARVVSFRRERNPRNPSQLAILLRAVERALNRIVQIRELIKTFNISAFCKEANLSGAAPATASHDFSPSLTAPADLCGICVMRDERRALRNCINYKS
jgi:hypothetical protein